MLKIRKTMRNQKGFTLVELIIVIAILGILSALVVPRFMGTLETQREKTNLANIRTVQNAYDLYLADNNGKSADSINELTTKSKYLDELPTIEKAGKFQNEYDETKWDIYEHLVTYYGKTYSDWERDDGTGDGTGDD